MSPFLAMADPTRRSILEMLARAGSMPAREIGAHYPISAPAISQHLKILREAGLVEVRAVAQQRFYRLRTEGLGEMEDWLARTRWFQQQAQLAGKW